MELSEENTRQKLYHYRDCLEILNRDYRKEKLRLEELTVDVLSFLSQRGRSDLLIEYSQQLNILEDKLENAYHQEKSLLQYCIDEYEMKRKIDRV